MAPTPAFQDLARRSRGYHHSNGAALGGGVGGGVVVFVLVVMLIVFICVYYSKSKKANLLHARNGTPINKSKILGESLLIAFTLGLGAFCLAECCGADDANNDNGGGAAPQMGDVGGGGGGGFVAPPAPTYQPQMDWGPVQSAAEDPIV